MGTHSLYKELMAILVQPSPSRATVSEEIEGLRIIIPGRWNWGLLFVAFWLCAWTFAGIMAGRALLQHFSFFLCFWMLGWAFGEFFAGYSLLYAVGGRQIIVAGSETLTCRTEVFGLGWGKSYFVRELKNLRFQPTRGGGRGQLASRIAFDYGSRTIGFGGGLQEAEATELIGRIRQRCAIADLATSQGSGTKFWGR